MILYLLNGPAKWAAGALAALSMLLAAWSKGKSDERLKHTEDALNAIKEKREIEEEVSSLDARARRDELRRWGKEG